MNHVSASSSISIFHNNNRFCHLFFIALALPLNVWSAHISRSRSSPHIFHEAYAHESVSQTEHSSPLIDHIKAQFEQSRIQHLQSNLEQAKQSTKSDHNFELHADTKPLPRQLAESSLKHAPRIIDTIVYRLNNRAEVDKELMPKKLMLVGEPGTGKTTLGKAIAHACNMPVMKYTASAIADCFKDSGPKNLEKIFYEAGSLNKPCIVIIDELEALMKRHDNKNDSEAGMLITLWTLLDQFENSLIFFVGTLNDMKEAPQQVKNRFSEYIEYVPLPDAGQRKDLLEFYMSLYKKIRFEDIVLDQLVQLTEGFAHRNIKALVNVAGGMAYLRNPKTTTIIMDDFLQALQEIDKKAAYIHEGRLYKIGKKILKWGPVITVPVAVIGLVGLAHNITMQKEALVVQQKALAIQKQSLAMQESTLALGVVSVVGTGIFKFCAWLFGPK